jgi:hypothetical protein
MNEFRMSLLKERADKIRPDLTKARQMMEEAEAEKRDLTDEEKAFTEPTLKTARDIADSMAKTTPPAESRRRHTRPRCLPAHLPVAGH